MRSVSKHRPAAAELAKAEALTRAGRLGDALGVLEEARERHPSDAEILLELARIALRLALPQAAERCTAAALEIEPANIAIAIERSVALRACSRHDDAITLLRASLTEDPLRAELWLALSNTVREIGLVAEAETFLDEALRLNPRNAEARANLADLLFDRGEIARAKAEYDEAIRRAPRNAQMHFNRALLLLHDGDLDAGWRDYEWRLQVEANRIERIFPGEPPKRWDGAARNGQSLLVMAEQGLGDQILFASLLPDLAARDDGPILVDCEPRLAPLISRSFASVHVRPYEAKLREGRTEIDYAWTQAYGGAAFSIDLGSLPRLLRPSIASFPFKFAPYKADAGEAAHWRQWLDGLGTGAKVGICWRSGRRGALRNLQYAPLESWAAFIARTKADLIAVQYDQTDEELGFLSAACDRPLHVPPDLDQRGEIDRLTALLSGLDALVSAPTVVATLAAAVGTPTLKVTQAGSWTALGGEREAFLPAARIIRPPRAGDWPEAFRLAGLGLEALLSR